MAWPVSASADWAIAQMTYTDAILDRLRTEQTLADNGGHPILSRSFGLAIAEIEAFRAELSASCGYMRNASIDLSTGCPKATAIRTIEGGLKRFEAFLHKRCGKCGHTSTTEDCERDDCGLMQPQFRQSSTQ